MTPQKPNPKRNDQNSWKPGNDWAMSLNHGKVITWKWLNEWSEQLNNLFKISSQKQSHPFEGSCRCLLPHRCHQCFPLAVQQDRDKASNHCPGYPAGQTETFQAFFGGLHQCSFFSSGNFSGTQSWCTWHHLSRREMNWTLDRVVVWFKGRPMTYGREYHSMV